MRKRSGEKNRESREGIERGREEETREGGRDEGGRKRGGREEETREGGRVEGGRKGGTVEWWKWIFYFHFFKLIIHLQFREMFATDHDFEKADVLGFR